MTNTPSLVAASGGYLAECECQWIKWWPKRAEADRDLRAHATTCKGAPVKEHAAPKAARTKTDWTGREGSTWIDKL